MTIAEISNLAGGGILGIVIVSICTLLGLLIRRNGSIITARIGAVPKSEENMVKFITELRQRTTDLEKQLSTLDRRELTFIRLMASIGGELRVLNGYLGVHMIEIKAENLDREELNRQCEEIRHGINILINLIDTEERQLSQETPSQYQATLHSQYPIIPARRENEQSEQKKEAGE